MYQQAFLIHYHIKPTKNESIAHILYKSDQITLKNETNEVTRPTQNIVSENTKGTKLKRQNLSVHESYRSPIIYENSSNSCENTFEMKESFHNRKDVVLAFT